jgi:hypothetical protein
MQSKNMWSLVPVIPGHHGQSSVYRSPNWWSSCGVTILLCNVLQQISLSAEDGMVTECIHLGVLTSQWHSPFTVICSFEVNKNLLFVVFLSMSSGVNWPLGCLMAKPKEDDVRDLICCDKFR